MDDARQRAGLSQQELGQLTGISQSQLSKYLRGERAMLLDELDSLCAALRLDIVAVVRRAVEEARKP